MSTCENCTAPTRDAAYLCDGCIDKAARALADIPWLEEQLELTITRQDRIERVGGVRVDDDKPEQPAKPSEAATGAPAKPSPYNQAAHDARERLRAAMVTAIRFSGEEGVRTSDPAVTAWTEGLLDNLTAMSRWLMWRLDGLALNDMGPQFVADIVKAVRDCRRVIDMPPERRYAGRCPECEQHDVVRDLYHRPDAKEASCSGCGQRFDVEAVSKWMRDKLDDHLTDLNVTAHEAATLLGRYGIEVPLKTIESWSRRGRLEAHGTKPQRYRWDDLKELAIQHAARKGA